MPTLEAVCEGIRQLLGEIDILVLTAKSQGDELPPVREEIVPEPSADSGQLVQRSQIK